MELKYAFIAQATTLSTNGSLNAVGIFEQVMSKSFPTTHPHISLAVCFHIKPADAGQKRNLDVRLITDDGTELISLRAVMELPPPPLPQYMPPGYQVFEFNNVHLPKPGTYEFDIRIDGQAAGTVPFVVLQAA